MSTQVAVFNPSQLPAHLRKAELSETAKALMGSGASGKRISIKGGVFRLLDAGKEVASIEERYLDVVIVNAAPKVARVWYAKAYDGESAVAPSCWSANGDTPDASIEEPQASHCADCEKNVAGSGQGTSRACRFQQRVAVILADDITAESDVMQLTVPAASLFGKADGDKRPLQDYARWLAAQKVSPEALVTRLRFDTAAESPKLWFKPMRWLEQDEYDAAVELGASDEAKAAITMTVTAHESAPSEEMAEVKGKPPARKTKPKADEDADPPARKPKPQADEDDEPPAARKAKPKADDEDDEPPAARKAKPKADDEDDEPPAARKAKPKADDEDDVKPPARRKKAEAPAAPPKADLAALVGDWDDE
jgi:hypothetical protein